MNKYRKYDISTKVALVEEYLEIIKRKKISMAEFAYEKDIADSTFNDWVIKYRKSKDKFINNGSNFDDVIDISSSDNSMFIELSKDTFKPLVTDTQATTLTKSSDLSTSVIKLNYKDISLEFGVNELDKVMEILKRW